MMQFIKRIRIFFFHYFLDNELKKAENLPRTMVGFEAAKTIGILFDGTNMSDQKVVESIQESWRQKGKKVRVLAFINAPAANSHLNIESFSRNDINWYLKPISPLVHSFINSEFDILMNAYFEENLPLEYISTLSKAKFRVGIPLPHSTHHADFMVQIKEPSLQVFFDTLKHYLKIFTAS